MNDEPLVPAAGAAAQRAGGRAAWRVPSRFDAVWFAIRAAWLIVKRALRNAFDPKVIRHARHVERGTAYAAVLAQSRTPLWSDGRPEEFVLVAGKVHNLRVARNAFDGVLVPAGATLSFWKQLGWPGRVRGYVEGREIRSGCVVPTIAGGICQLTQALAQCARQAGFRFTERHGHTARIEDSANPDDIDATVFWNYLDLRFVAPVGYRIEVELDQRDLVVKFLAMKESAPSRTDPSHPVPILAKQGRSTDHLEPLPVARGCLTCDQSSCFRHRGAAAARVGAVDSDKPASEATATRGRSAWLLNGRTPELAAMVDAAGAANAAGVANAAVAIDLFVPAAWPLSAPTAHRLRRFRATHLRRRVALRARLALGGVRQAAVVKGDALLARAYSRALDPLHTHLMLDQSLLLPLAKAGVLAGRSCEVYLHALPAAEVQRRLELAHARWPDDASLRDFRQSQQDCETELQALLRATRLISPHVGVAAHLRAMGAARVDLLPWHRPTEPVLHAPAVAAKTRPTVVFPASALARKGARELAQALRGLPCRLLVLGTPSSDPELWRGIEVQHASFRPGDWLAQADVVVLPAHVEHAPRSLLVALAWGVPVIATPACGLGVRDGLLEVPAGDVRALRAALELVTGGGGRRPAARIASSGC